MRRCTILGTVPWLVVVVLLAWSAPAGDDIRYNRDIRPILSDNCFHCHGPDRNRRESGMRLDIREEALKAAKSGKTPIVPGKPDRSELVSRIFHADVKQRMPPERAHKTLTDAQKDLLKRWIAAGAVYEPHWAYTPLAKPVVPSPVKAALVRNPIDAFVQAGLAPRKIDPAPEADRRTLIRRLSLDLLGLPPTPAEVDAFVADAAPDAYEKLVKRLLASPHYGERMAQHWLDLARYADTVGFHGDQNQSVFPYRDYVIDAFNRNKPFDRFTIEQIAGDLLPDAGEEQWIASCFNRLNMMTREGGAQAKEYLAKYTADRVRTVGTTWLGGTLGCAECHDHKFDPYTMKDFYSLGAFFADVKQYGVYSSYNYTPEPELEGWSNEYPFPPEIWVKNAALEKRLAAAVARRDAAAKSAHLDTEALRVWREEVTKFIGVNPSGWAAPAPKVTVTAAEPEKNKKPAAPAGFEVRPDGVIVFEPGPVARTQIDVPLPEGWLSALRIELLPDAKHKGRISRTTGDSLDFRMAFSRVPAKGRPEKIEFRHAQADHFAPIYSGNAIARSVANRWRTAKADVTQPHTAVFLPEQPFRAQAGETLRVTIPDCDAGAVRVSVTPRAPATIAGLTEGDETVQFLRSTGNDTNAFALLKQAEADAIACDGGKARVQITKKTDKPLTIRILPRGNWQDDSGEVCAPATPHFLPVLSGVSNRPLDRLDLAKWLVSPQNPVTPRVAMNRLWRQFFGNALSAQADDVGSQGETPSHPELLDWLAAEFRDGGWDFRRMVELIVTSHTYRQVAGLRNEVATFDPQNRLLSAQNPRRLEAEIVRDNALAIAGLLNLEMGGPACKPYQPPGLYADLQFPDREYQNDVDAAQWRRGVYMWWQRTFVHPMLMNFDAPSREDCVAMRSNANTPQQALTLLNDTQFVEAAHVWAAKLLAEQAADDAARIELAWREALARPPLPAEKARLSGLLEKARAEYKARPEDAAKFLHHGYAPVAAGDPVELAAWATVCRVVLNLHETITRY